MDIPNFETFGQWGVLGLLAWLLVRTFTHTTSEYRQATKDAHQQYDATLTAQRKDFTQALSEDRADHLSCLERMKDAVTDLARRCPGGKMEGG